MAITTPTTSYVVFLSGDDGWLHTYDDIRRYGMIFKRCWITPSDFTKDRYRIPDDKLDYTIVSTGAVVKEYPLEHFHIISSSPAHPMVLITCGWNGEDILSIKLAEESSKLVRKDDVIASLLTENATLRQRLKALSERMKRLGVET